MNKGPSAFVRIIKVSHRYKARGRLVLDRVTLDIEPGERVALLGRSGCGKSTLLQIISGLLKPSEGQLEIDRVAVTGPSPRWNLMFQKPLLLPWLTVEQNIALGLRFNGRRREATVRVAQLLELIGMKEFAKVRSTELSGGQQQRVALARSLATEPTLLLLDEPYASLDPATRDAMREQVRNIVGELGLTLLVVTHDVEDALHLATRAVFMAPNPGRLMAEIDLAGTHRSEIRSVLLDHFDHLPPDLENPETLDVPALL